MRKLRKGRILYANPTSSITFLLDGTATDPDEFEYLQKLAGIAAYTLPLDTVCGSFYLVGYYERAMFSFRYRAHIFLSSAGHPAASR